MKLPPPLPPGKSMLGAALAGLSLMSTEAEATVFVESTDFSSNYLTPTDLGSTFTNFLDNHRIDASLDIAGADYIDYFQVNVAPSTLVTLDISASASQPNPYLGISAYSSSGTQLSTGYLFSMPEADTTYYGFIPSFTTPADGILVFRVSSEASGGTINYSVGAIPEPTSALLGAAGLAAAALRRRRDGK